MIFPHCPAFIAIIKPIAVAITILATNVTPIVVTTDLTIAVKNGAANAVTSAATATQTQLSQPKLQSRSVQPQLQTQSIRLKLWTQSVRPQSQI